MQSGIAYLVAALIDYALHGAHCLISSGCTNRCTAILLRSLTVGMADRRRARSRTCRPNVIEDPAITGFEFPANASIRRSRFLTFPPIAAWESWAAHPSRLSRCQWLTHPSIHFI